MQEKLKIEEWGGLIEYKVLISIPNVEKSYKHRCFLSSILFESLLHYKEFHAKIFFP